jgi:hypothetical protein
MKWFAIVLLFGLGACSKQADTQQTAARPLPATNAASQSKAVEKQGMAMSALIPIPKDKVQLDRMLAIGYTVHENHMHPPGVKQCPFDTAGGSVVQ